MCVVDIINSWLEQPIISTVLGAVIGTATSIVISYYFAKRSSKQLANEASHLRSLITELARLMHEAGWIKAAFDDEGNLLRIFPLRGEAHITSRAHITASADLSSGQENTGESTEQQQPETRGGNT